MIDDYRSLIGALLWIANVSRPDISYTVSTLSRFAACPEKAHMKAALRALSYLEKTSGMTLKFGDFTGRGMCGDTINAPKQLMVFTDSSWGDEKPASGYACFLMGSLITWASKRLKTTPLSSCESEYLAATNAATNAIFLRELLSDLAKEGGDQTGPTPIYCDNSAACQLADDALSGKRVKHAMRKLTYLRELSEEKKIILKFVPGEVNPADIFTKCLAGPRFIELRKSLLGYEASEQQDSEEEQATTMAQFPRETAPRRVLVLFSGPYNRPDGLQHYLAEQGLQAVMLDNNEGQGGNAEHDLTNDEFYSKLLKQVQMGDFVAIMAAPPCSI